MITEGSRVKYRPVHSNSYTDIPDYVIGVVTHISTYPDTPYPVDVVFNSYGPLPCNFEELEEVSP